MGGCLDSEFQWWKPWVGAPRSYVVGVTMCGSFAKINTSPRCKCHPKTETNLHENSKKQMLLWDTWGRNSKCSCPPPPWYENSVWILTRWWFLTLTRWWFRTCFIFTPTWGNDLNWLIFSNGLKPPTSWLCSLLIWGRLPSWLIFFRCVETTWNNQPTFPKCFVPARYEIEVNYTAMMPDVPEIEESGKPGWTVPSSCGSTFFGALFFGAVSDSWRCFLGLLRLNP